MARCFTGFTLDPDVVRELDRVRGDVPRSRLVERMIRENLGMPSPAGVVENGE